jgi:hypothetical protein
METITEDKAIYKTINEKMGDTVSLSVEKLHLSEYNTRSTCIDMKHVDYLAERIRERGFHPKRAISVNVIRGAGGVEITYRVAAGIHRMEAARKAGLSELPCLLYYDLTEEEECLLDKWDNEMDEDHKPIHFLEEAEHYKYLLETKGWSQNKIARNKNVARGIVQWKLQIANLPEEAKVIVRGCHPGGTLFFEKYFRDICKLKGPHIIAICEEIATRGTQAEKGEKDRLGRPVTPMKQTEIRKRVDELLKLENDGKGLARVKEAIPTQMTLFDNEEPEEKQFVEKTVLVEMGEEHEPAEEAPPTPQTKREVPAHIAYRDQDKNSKGLIFYRVTQWLDFTDLVKEMGPSTFMLLQKMEKYDLWYRANEDKPFFFSDGIDAFAYLARQVGIEKEHLQKRTMAFLKSGGFIDYWTENGIYWFKLNWDRLFEIYRRDAYTIPFRENGLEDIPPNFSGVIRPTPFHYIRIEKGQVISWNGDAAEVIARAQENGKNENDSLTLALRALTPPMGEKEIAFCRERWPETERVLKLLDEMKPEQRRTIQSEAAYVLELVRRGPSLPKDFVTPEEARERSDTQQKRMAFLSALKKGSYTYFCPPKGTRYKITMLDDNGFEVEKEDGSRSYFSFEDWMMDIKYFT